MKGPCELVSCPNSSVNAPRISTESTFFDSLNQPSLPTEGYGGSMSARRPLVVVLIVAAVIGAFFLGRASVTPTATPTTSVRTTSVVATNFSPLSVSFTSLDTAWSLGTDSCGSKYHCLELIKTSDRGRTWSKETLPSPLLESADRNFEGTPAATYGAADLNVRFANSHDGWVFGLEPGRVPSGGLTVIQYQPVLWATHDGGRSWHPIKLRGLPSRAYIFDLETSRSKVYVLFENESYGVTVESSSIANDDWQRSNTKSMELPAGGANPTGSIVLEGSAGWLVAGNDRGVSGSAQLVNGSWVPWRPPCYAVGNSYAVPAASNSNDLVAICAMGGFAYDLSKSAPPGATLGSSWLYFSSNGGRTFESGPEVSRQNAYFYSLIASPSPRTILLDRQFEGSTSQSFDLVASFDGGVHWTKVYPGSLSYLDFSSPRQGVGIVHPDHGSNSMIMTFDGGRTWKPVMF